jgi:hypothetical protein
VRSDVEAAAAPTPPTPERIVEVAPAQPEPTPQPKHDAAPRIVQELPPVALTLPPDSGLELIETRHVTAPAIVPEPAPAGPRRVRPPRVVIADEPLQIIETRKDSSPPPG